MTGALGLHLVQHLDLVDSPRRSVLVRLDADARLRDVGEAAGDDAVVALAAGHEAASLTVDAPLAVPDDAGRRDAEAVLAWCDVSAFPVSRRRLEQVTGGTRGIALAPALAAAGHALAEALPDQVLRQVAWEHDHPLGAAPLPLADYRTAWIGVRAPVYRPKGVGRARPGGTLAAWEILRGVVDMDGWAPGAGAVTDWDAIRDAAVIDAICCAYAGLRVARGQGLLLGTAARGLVAVPADANLHDRLTAALGRMRDEGAVAI